MRSGILVVVTLVALLTGCAVSPAPTPTSEPVPSGSPTPVAAPGSRVPLTCDEIAPTADIAAVVGSEPTLEVPGDFFLDDLIAPETAGVRLCKWSSEQQAEALRLTVTADSDDLAQFQVVRPQGFEVEPQLVDTIGTRSFLGCQTYGAAGTGCYYSVLTDAYWFGGYLTSGPVTVEAAQHSVSALLADVVERLTAAPPLPEWTPPQHSTADLYDCSWMDRDAAVASAVGEEVGYGASGSTGPPIDQLAGIYEGRVGARWCSLESRTLSIGFVAGSAWAWATASAGWSEHDVPGAAAAVSRCELERELWRCDIRALVDDTIVQASGYAESGEADTLARVTAGLEAGITVLPLAP